MSRLHLLLPLLLAACTTPPQAVPGSPAPSTGEPAAPAPPAASATVSAAPGMPAAAPTASESAAPIASASAAPVAGASAAPATEPVPAVEVENIGMHIGGGPNDAVTKAPIRKSVEPHFDELARCWAKLGDATRKGDMGVDLRIERGGGKAKVSHPRSTFKDAEFERCVVGVLEATDFLPPKGGATVVSYSLRFTPKGKR